MARRAPLSNPDEVIRYLEEDGGVIITGFTSIADLDQVTADARPFLEKIEKDRTTKGLPQGTRRCFRLFGRSETAREKWLQQPEFLKIIRHFLQTFSIPYNHKPENQGITTDPILSAGATLEVCPGQPKQSLHRDDYIWQQTHDGGPREKYTVGQDVGVALLVPAVDTTIENGATNFVPGSHLWDHSRTPKPEEVAYAVMSPGEAFMFLGSTVHAGGENTSTVTRPVHGFFFCRGYIRPEENQFVWWTKEEVSRWSPAAQKQAGYICDAAWLGHSDEGNPIDHFRDAPTLAEPTTA